MCTNNKKKLRDNGKREKKVEVKENKKVSSAPGSAPYFFTFFTFWVPFLIKSIENHWFNSILSRFWGDQTGRRDPPRVTPPLDFGPKSEVKGWLFTPNSCVLDGISLADK